MQTYCFWWTGAAITRSSEVFPFAAFSFHFTVCDMDDVHGNISHAMRDNYNEYGVEEVCTVYAQALRQVLP
jgi:hypothetical protein